MSTPAKAGRLVRVGLYDLTPGYLGKGNFAIVRLGIHRLSRTSVAVKIVEKTDLDEENLQKISREIEIMRHLSHPSIVKLFQVSLLNNHRVNLAFGCWYRRYCRTCASRT